MMNWGNYKPEGARPPRYWDEECPSRGVALSHMYDPKMSVYTYLCSYCHMNCEHRPISQPRAALVSGQLGGSSATPENKLAAWPTGFKDIGAEPIVTYPSWGEMYTRLALLFDTTLARRIADHFHSGSVARAELPNERGEYLP